MYYPLFFYVPAAIVALFWLILLLRERSEWSNPLLWAALFASLATAAVAVWAMVHRSHLRERSYLDYRYEVAAVTISLLAFALSLIWARRPAQKLAWLPTLAAAWLSLLWLVVITTQL
jgi:hypothetical protein